jgi:hypothetical protein
MSDEDIPYGYCHCGCGEKTAIPDTTNARLGRVAGRPNRVIKGHYSGLPAIRAEHRKRWEDAGIRYGECLCGCGTITALGRKTQRAKGEVEGEPVKHIRGHSWRKSPVEYIEEDCGYETPCWVWQRARKAGGYGSAWLDGRSIAAYKLVWERHNGPVLDGLDLDHLCRNPPCVNPSHLEPVTHAINSQRGARAKLTPELVRMIRCSAKTDTALARELGVGQPAVSDARAGRTWANTT